jgi:hypothetical protein
LYNDDEYVPYIDENCNRINWEISIKNGNYISTFKDSEEKYIDGFTNISLKVNNKEYYSLICNNIDEGFNKIRNIIYKLEKLPIDYYEPYKTHGKKIYYKGLPAIIEMILENGHLIIKPDCIEKDLKTWWNNLIEPWFNEEQINEIYEGKFYNKLKVNIIDDNIHWFRNDRLSKLLKIKMLIGH